MIDLNKQLAENFSDDRIYPLMNNPMGKRFRIRSKNDFSRVFDRGTHTGDSVLTLLVIPNGKEYCRFGIAVSRRHGNAVKRNRVKRLCRAAIGQAKINIPLGWDVMVIPKAKRTVLTLDALASSLLKLSTRAITKAQ